MSTTARSIQDRVALLDWKAMTRDLDSFGCTIIKSVLRREECRSLAAMYERDDIFRLTVVMARHGFGRGEYKYWSYPLPEIVADLRTALYPPLAAVANRWNQSTTARFRREIPLGLAAPLIPYPTGRFFEDRLPRHYVPGDDHLSLRDKTISQAEASH